MPTTFIELNHTLEDGMPAYPGLPNARITALMDHAASRHRYQGQAEFYLGKVEMPCNVGTYLDSPFHRYREREDLSQVPLDRLAGLRGVVLDAPITPARAVHPQAEGSQLAGAAVLIRTGWDALWGTKQYWQPGPYLATSFLDLLLRSNPALVGVDFWNVDDPGDPSRPAHTRLLGAGILVVEHLANLAALPPSGFRFYAVPLRIVRGASFPVRAFAEVDA